jgi:hypothetical protein
MKESVMRKSSLLCYIVLIALFGVFPTANAFELIKDNRLRLDGIVLSASPTPSEKRAAEELARYLGKSANAKIPVITEKPNLPKGKYIYAGACEAGKEVGINPDEFSYNHGQITVKGDAVYIIGKDDNGNYNSNNTSTGTLFAAYEFLENFLGVRWLWPGELGEVVPSHENLEITDTVLAVTPKVQSSLWRTTTGMKSGWRNLKNQQKFAQEQMEWLKRHRFSCDTGFQLGHAFTDYYQRYSKEHPEFFSLLPDGTRRPNPYSWSKGNPKFVSMCVSNPELVRTVVDNWKSGNPRQKIINLNENDTAGECTCPACLAADNSPEPPEVRLARAKEKFDRKDGKWFTELGSLSDRYSRFYLDVQKEADKIDPTHRIMGLIYTNFNKPPSDKIKLNDRITLRFCPPYMYPWTEQKIQDYKNAFSGWAGTGAKLMFRPNFTHDGSYFPVQYQDVFYDLYTFSAPDMIAVDMDSLTGHYAVQGLVNYVIATLNHDRDTPLDTLKDTFFSAFGAAKPFIKEYFDYLTEVSMNSPFDPNDTKTPEGGSLYLDLFTVADSLFTPQVMDKCRALLEQAANAPGLDPTAVKRVEFLKNGLKNVELTMAAQVEFRKHRQGAPIDSFAKSVQKLDQFRASIEDSNAFNMGNIRMLEDRRWPSRARLYLTGTNRTELTDWKILFDPQNVGLKEKWYLPTFDFSKAESIKTNPQARNEMDAIRKERFDAKAAGTVWYYNRLDKIKADKGNMQLLFYAIDGNARIFLNGKQIFARSIAGDRYFWKDPLLIDIPTDLLKPRDNLLVIRTDRDTARSGIWQPVHILYSE